MTEPTPPVAYGSRRSAYGFMVGGAVALIATAVVVPYVAGERIEPTPRSFAPASLSTSLPGTTTPSASVTTAPGGAGTGTDAGGPAGGGAGPGTADGGDTGPGAPPGPTVALTASDVGVTPTAIKVAIFYPNEAAVTGNETLFGDQPAAWKAYVDDVNARGGVHGRQIEPMLRSFNPFSADDKRAACIQATREAKVFVVLNVQQYFSEDAPCVTQENETLFLSYADNPPADHFVQSGGLAFSMQASGTRSLRALVEDLHARGALTGHRLGLVDLDAVGAKRSVDTGLVATLDRLGYDLTHRATLPGGTSNLAGGQSQIPVQVQQMKAKGVDVVFLMVHALYGSQWTQQAEAQQWRPQYYVSDFASGASDETSTFMTASFDGAIGYTTLRTGEQRVGLPETPLDAECRRIYEASSGKALDRNGSAYKSTLGACALVRAFVAGAAAAGPDLTRSSFSTAVQQLGPLDIPYTAGGSFAPGKFDAADLLRTVRWEAQCACWKPTGDFQPMRG